MITMGIRKKYISPKIEIHRIDQEICLVMESPPVDPGGGGDPWDPAAAPASTPEYPSTLSDDSPFGGSTPDYDNM